MDRNFVKHDETENQAIEEMKKKSVSWVSGVRKFLQAGTPHGWVILDKINGRGVQLLPNDFSFLSKNQSKPERDLVGKNKIVFEFFRLDKSGDVKISARIAGTIDNPMFNQFWGIARALGCPKPKDTKKTSTQSVAAWPSHNDRPSFDADDYEGMVEWIRKFLQNPPPDFVLFVAAARNLLNS